MSTVVWWYGPQAGVLTTNHLFPTLSLLTLSPLTVDAMIASVCACTVSVVASCRLLHVSARTQGLTLLQYWMRHTMPLNYVETRLSGAQFAASRGWVTGIDYHGPTSPDEVAQAMNTDKDRANRAGVIRSHSRHRSHTHTFPAHIMLYELDMAYTVMPTQNAGSCACVCRLCNRGTRWLAPRRTYDAWLDTRCY